MPCRCPILRGWQHQQSQMLCRHLKVVGSGSTSSLVSGISALQNLEHLDIEVGDSLGTIGKLHALTRLRIESDGLGLLHELHLETPKLQCLSLEAIGNTLKNIVVRSILLLCTSSYNPRCVYQHRHLVGGCYLQDERMWRCLSSLKTLQELTHGISTCPTYLARCHC